MMCTCAHCPWLCVCEVGEGIGHLQTLAVRFLFTERAGRRLFRIFQHGAAKHAGRVYLFCILVSVGSSSSCDHLHASEMQVRVWMVVRVHSELVDIVRWVCIVNVLCRCSACEVSGLCIVMCGGCGHCECPVSTLCMSCMELVDIVR